MGPYSRLTQKHKKFFACPIDLGAYSTVYDLATPWFDARRPE
jgi:hypothetical protein